MKDLETQWLYEESIAQIHGWDFSHIEERYQEEDDLPWDYKTLVQKYVRPEDRLLDMDTGGGEFLRSIRHPYELTSVTEGYAPNLELCRETLSPLGIDVREWQEGEPLPFADGSMDIILNRHGSFEVREIQRVLRPGGIFLTQQVGEDNDRELVELLLPGVEKPYPGWNLRNCRKAFEKAGFQILEQGEAMRPIRFFRRRRSGLVCACNLLGVSRIFGGAVQKRAVSGSGDIGEKGRNRGKDSSFYVGSAKMIGDRCKMPTMSYHLHRMKEYDLLRSSVNTRTPFSFPRHSIRALRFHSP